MERITEWTHTSAKLWDESPSLSTETALAGIVAKLTTLEWVPYFNSTKPKSREILENPLIFQNIVPGGMQLPTDPRSAIEQLQSSGQNVSTLRDSVNRWRSFQKLYQDCGWGIDTFDGGEFERRRQEWCARLDDLDRQKRIARRMSEAQREALRLATERFWAESADSNGV